MNKENVAKLITALRSGEYSQGRQVLRIDDTFCCLGVACDISGLGTWEMSKDGWRYVIRDENDTIVAKGSSVLPRAVANWLGIEEAGEFHIVLTQKNNENRYNRYFTDEEYPIDAINSLAELNDTCLTFDQIADVLENADAFDWESSPKVRSPFTFTD